MTYERIVEWEDGYPTAESLDRLWEATIDHTNAADCIRAELTECAKHCCARYSETSDTQRAMFSTGGWSGAEDLIDAMMENPRLKHRHIEWHRGGHHVFDVAP